MKHVVCFVSIDNRWGEGHRARMRSISTPYIKAQWVVKWLFANDRALTDKLREAGHVYVWNGSDPYTKPAQRIALCAGARVFCVENGHFPQSDYNIVAENGLYGRHPGLSLDWDALLTEKDYALFRAAREALQKWRDPIRGVLSPLQIKTDVTMRHYANGYTNDDLIAMPLKDKWIRNHPLASAKDRYGGPACDDYPCLEYTLGRYDSLVGINSTVLYQGGLMGLQVTALGQSYFGFSKDRDVALAALFACQIPIQAKDFSAWMFPGRGMEQLNDL